MAKPAAIKLNTATKERGDKRDELPCSATDAEIERMAWRLFEARRNDNGEDGTDEC